MSLFKANNIVLKIGVIIKTLLRLFVIWTLNLIYYEIKPDANSTLIEISIVLSILVFILLYIADLITVERSIKHHGKEIDE